MAEGVGAFVAEVCRVAGTADADGIHDEENGAGHVRDPCSMPFVDGALVRPARLRERVGGAHASRRPPRPGPRRARGRAERAVRADRIADPDLGQADGMVDGVLRAGVRPPPSSTTASPRARVSIAATKPVASGGAPRRYRSLRQIFRRALDEIGGAAERARPCARKAPPRAAGERGRHMGAPRRRPSRRCRRASSISQATAARRQQPRVAMTRRVRKRHGVRHLHRVAGGGGERLAHVGDERARAGSPAPFATWTRLSASSCGVRQARP